MWVYPEIRTVDDIADYYARHQPERLALSYQGRETSFGALNTIASAVANALASASVRAGDRVAYLGKNSDAFFMALFGTSRAGACFTPLNWRLAVAELAPIVLDSEARFAFVEQEFMEMWTAATARLQSPPKLLVLDMERPDASITAWCAGAVQGTPDRSAHSLDDGAIQMYTSGTTGVPKGVVITHGGLNNIRLCEHFEPSLQWADDDRYLFALPNFHLLGIGLSLQLLYNGVNLIVLRQFDPGQVLEAIAQQRPTILVVAPAMIQMILDHPKAAETDFSSLRLTMYAGSPIALGLIKRAIAAMPCRFMQFYGATEMVGAVTLLRPDEHDLDDEAKLKSCGRPIPLIALRIVDDAGKDVPDGTPGELLVRTPALAIGYWRKPEATAANFINGWYHTGDVAYRDAEGLYYIYDRLKDMIVTGGENVYSAEIENVLSTHPGVSAVAVIGVPDERWGEAVSACVIPKGGQTLDPAELIAFCRAKLAGYKVPKAITFMESFPMTGSGKISKKDLRQPFWESQGRGVG